MEMRLWEVVRSWATVNGAFAGESLCDIVIPEIVYVASTFTLLYSFTFDA